MSIAAGLASELVVGLVSVLALAFFADEVVERMKAVAAHYQISGVVIAMTVISFGTSLPEITSHLVASHGILVGTMDYQVASATVLGGNIGSNVVQQTMILGLTVLIAGSLRLPKKVIQRDYLPMIGAHVLTLALVIDGTVSRLDGVMLLLTFSLYIYYLYRTRHEELISSGESSPSQKPHRDMIIAVVAMIAVVYAAQLFLGAVESVVEQTGLGGSMVAVVTLGIAAALPEFTTAVEALRKNAGGISIGTLIGSNITNPLVGIGLGSAISTYAVPRGLYTWDLPMGILTGILLLGYVRFGQDTGLIPDRRIEKVGGLMLVVLYIFYIYFRFQYFPVDMWTT